ncbi:MAG: prepilin-type N-terminal cleavage/methylation domain-containing protein [Phycisphaerae bacterium]|nr:prepilin-type N-terminal cleavage/methylation domain-containing protein [Phycisphaerae bacterium]
MRRRSALRFRPAEDRLAFTLVEILIVVIILGILAVIVIPQFSNASHISRENTLRDDLRFLRMQIGVYRVQHRDVSPGYLGGLRGTPDAGAFTAQMTQFTDCDGNAATSPTPTNTLGPYLSRIPMNPLNAESDVLIIPDGQAMPDPGTFPIMNGQSPYGWIYQPQSQTIVANVSGVDTNGVAYSSY